MQPLVSLEVAVAAITLGSFAAAFVNAAFATGGIYIQLAVGSSVLPLSAAVPLQSAVAFASLASRVVFFWQHIHWPIAVAFAAGAVFGTAVGARVFISMSESVISLALGALLLLIVWAPAPRYAPPLKHPFALVGILHGFLGTVFGVGLLLQPTILRTRLSKLQITGTLAACLLAMDVFKIINYVAYGFNYLDYLPHIVGAALAGFAGTLAGRRVADKISERQFRIVFKTLLTLVAIRLLIRGWQNLIAV